MLENGFRGVFKLARDKRHLLDDADEVVSNGLSCHSYVYFKEEFTRLSGLSQQSSSEVVSVAECVKNQIW